MASASAAIPADAPVILAFGDSLYAGYRLAPGQGYPPRLEAALNASGIKARVVNGGVSGDTTAAARARLADPLDGDDLLAVKALPAGEIQPVPPLWSTVGSARASGSSAQA